MFYPFFYVRVEEFLYIDPLKQGLKQMIRDVLIPTMDSFYT